MPFEEKGAVDAEAERGAERSTTFGPLVIEFDDSVLAPRPWTLAQSLWAAELAQTAAPGPILELYCGVGQIGLAVAHLANREIVQVDDNPRACELARRNAAAAFLDSDVRCASVDSALHAGERFPLVIADPPYLMTEDVDHYPDDPVHAVDGGEDGLEEITRCLETVSQHAFVGAAILLQVRGVGQATQLAPLLRSRGLPLNISDVRSNAPDRAIVLLNRGI